MPLVGLLAWVVTGAIAGWLAGKLMKSGGGVLIDIVVGIIGALIGGFFFNALGLAGTTGFSIWSNLVAFLGAMLLLTVMHLFSERERQHLFN